MKEHLDTVIMEGIDDSLQSWKVLSSQPHRRDHHRGIECDVVAQEDGLGAGVLREIARPQRPSHRVILQTQ